MACLHPVARACQQPPPGPARAAPTGTSPRAAAARASSIAISMKSAGRKHEPLMPGTIPAPRTPARCEACPETGADNFFSGSMPRQPVTIRYRPVATLESARQHTGRQHTGKHRSGHRP
ncbi:hypothetical protein SXCC_01167 [Gluconacetobacter sp. SXCC-1]|nr:hypothetical protein SXCC_01167 [Gluconacetobacter sp. SXCC-1]